jgi:LPXTG-site transpeptidase (sortase) family protein
MFRTFLRFTCIVLGSLLLFLGVAYGSGAVYLSWREGTQPSAVRVIQLANGQQIPLVQPSPQTAAPAAGNGSPPAASANSSAPAPAAEQQPLLPPESILLPSIATQWPIVLGDNENIPQFNAVGWLLGSGFPGHPGNMVLFGHQGGNNPTFNRLHEMIVGDEFSVATTQSVYRYRVRSVFETTPNDVAVLAPTNTPTATLITCAGPWDALNQTNERRLVVIADLVP